MKCKLYLKHDTEDVFCLEADEKIEHMLGFTLCDVELIETVECPNIDCDICTHQALGKHLCKTP